jgi:SAM-dependent methyltransferase
MICTVCGGSDFFYQSILWKNLITEWQISEYEVNYINRQQGLTCKICGSNLRSMSLAKAILNSYQFEGIFLDFIISYQAANLKILEINQAGSLTSFLQELKGHKLIYYPQYDMMSLKIDSSTYDLVIHSDTLEHIENPVTALSECRRVLSNAGRCIFTVPIIVDRVTRSRAGLSKSFHGTANEQNSDFLVHYEFGMDIWKYVLIAGFSSVKFHCLEYPAGLSIEARG